MRELRSLLPYLRPYRLTIAVGLAMVAVSNFFAVLGPRFLQQGIDALKYRLLAINLLVTPLLVCIFGVWFYRHRRK